MTAKKRNVYNFLCSIPISTASLDKLKQQSWASLLYFPYENFESL